MPHHNPSPDIDFILKHAEPYLSEPEMIFLGGSQVIANGAYVTRNSDFDLLLIGQNVKNPTSITAINEHGQHLELILRDRETLAYDVEEGRRRGYGTLITNGAQGRILMDKSGEGESLQETLRQIYATGPNPVEPASLIEQWTKLQRELSCLQSSSSTSSMHMIVVPDIVHSTAKTALRAVDTWSAKGKIVGRFLLNHLPDFKTRLEKVAYEAMFGNVGTLDNFLSVVAASLKPKTQSDLPLTRLRTLLPFPEAPATQEEAFYYLVRSDDARWTYRLSSHKPLREQAESWLRFKYDVVRKPVDPERLGRPSNEYFYALARYTGYLMEAAAAVSDKLPGKMSLSERATSLVNVMPAGAHRFLQDAYAGNPGAYLCFGDHLISRIVSLEGPILPRVSPQTCRRDPAIYGF